MLFHTALRKTAPRWTALTTAVALAVAPMAASAQENKGPPILRDTETEQLLRDFRDDVARERNRR